MKKSILLIITTIVLLFTACGRSREDVNDYIVFQGSRKASSNATVTVKTDSATNATLAAELAEYNAVQESSRTQETAESNGYNGIYYSSIDDLVSKYRSGIWDGSPCWHSGGSRAAVLDTKGELKEGKYSEGDGYYFLPGTGIYPDLPDGYTWDNCIQGEYNQHWYNCVKDVFTCLEPDGVHCYHHGQEVSFWSIDDVTEDAQLFDFHRYGRCVITEDRAVQCADNGQVSTIAEGIIGFDAFDGGTTETITFRDGEIQLWCCYRDNDKYHTIASNVIAATCTSTASNYENYRLNIIFTDVDGYTYFIEFESYDVESAIKADDISIELLHQYRLGAETPKYYAAEYQQVEDAYIAAWHSGEKDQARPVVQFLNQYGYLVD